MYLPNILYNTVILHFRPDQMNDELLIYHILLLLEPFTEKPWELVADFTHTTLENRFKVSYRIIFLLLNNTNDDHNKYLEQLLPYSF